MFLGITSEFHTLHFEHVPLPPTSPSQIHLSLHPYPPNFMSSFIFSENALRGISVAFILLGMCLSSGAYYTYQMLCPQKTLILHFPVATSYQ